MMSQVRAKLGEQGDSDYHLKQAHIPSPTEFAIRQILLQH